MRISKTKFINYLRCNRFAALEELYAEKEKAIVSFTDDLELEDLMSYENEMKRQVLLDDMYDENDEDLIAKENLQLETMMPYYNEVEIVSGRAIKHRFPGKTVYSMDTFKQKRFEFEHEGFRFFCFLDGYQEDDANIRIFETKATTSKKFMDLTYTDDGVKKSVFDVSTEGILMLAGDLYDVTSNQYQDKVKKLLNRLGKEGRYIYDIAYQRYVFEQSIQTIKNRSYYLAVLNSEYVHDGKTDANGHAVYTDDVVVFIDVTSLTEMLMKTVAYDIDLVIERLNTLNASPVALGAHCQRNDQRQCMFYDVCYAHIPKKNSLFTYIDNHHGFKDENGEKHDRFDLINEGVVSALDIPKGWLARENNIIQRDVMETNQPYYHHKKIKAGIKALIYPIYHLDFETFPAPLPRFKGEKPYSQSLFQYSIHVEHAPGVCHKDLDNFYFLAKNHEDIRESLIKSMLEVIRPDGGSVLVYNQAFEQTRLKEMAALFPAHRERLLDVVDRLFDLMHLLKGNTKLYKALGYEEDQAKGINFYHNDLNGSYSIKKVLPIFSDLRYEGMKVANGAMALTTYANFPNMDLHTFEQSYRDLLEYCKQDTWAMVEILDSLRKL
jgi:hypothetical protein